jgi:hypothetical protein
MQRITLVTGATGGGTGPYPPATFPPMGLFQANFAFSFEDQLATERPGVTKGVVQRSVDNAEPAYQLLSPIKDPNNPGTIYPGKREDEGRLSWMATLVPKLDRWSGTFEDKYVLSIVVFYNRSPNLAIPDYSGNVGTLTNINEYSAVILGRNNSNVSDFHSSGFGGGEVTLSIPVADPYASEKLKVRAGDWVMLSGHVRYAGGPTVPTFKWYRISDADEDPYQTTNATSNITYYQRDVTLVGPDWDLQDVLPFDTNTGLPQPDGIPDDVEVTIVPKVVTVFDRTIRLERDGTGY